MNWNSLFFQYYSDPASPDPSNNQRVDGVTGASLPSPSEDGISCDMERRVKTDLASSEAGGEGSRSETVNDHSQELLDLQRECEILRASLAASTEDNLRLRAESERLKKARLNMMIFFVRIYQIDLLVVWNVLMTNSFAAYEICNLTRALFI